jgi:hypothetical protein
VSCPGHAGQRTKEGRVRPEAPIGDDQVEMRMPVGKSHRMKMSVGFGNERGVKSAGIRSLGPKVDFEEIKRNPPVVCTSA